MVERDAKQRGVLETLARALSHEQHVLLRYPDLTFQQLYNGLRRHDESNGPVTFWAAAERGGFEKRCRRWMEWANVSLSIANGPRSVTLAGHSGFVRTCAFSPDGARIVSGGEDCRPRIWDAWTGAQLTTLVRRVDSTLPDRIAVDFGQRARRALESLFEDGEGHLAPVMACSYSPDGSRIVSGSCDKTLKVWDAQSGAWIATLTGHSAEVRACAYSPDGKNITSGGDDCMLMIWDAETGSVKRTLVGHSGAVTTCAYSPDGKCVLSGSLDHTLGLWDPLTGVRVRSFTGHSDKVNACAFSPDGERIISASSDGTMRIWDRRTASELAMLRGQAESSFLACAFSPDGRQIVSGSTGSMLNIWNAETYAEIATLAGHSDHVAACTYSPDGKRIVSAGGEDETLKIWDADVERDSTACPGRPHWGKPEPYSHDGRLVLSGNWESMLVVDAESLKPVSRLVPPSNWVLASGVNDDVVKVLDAEGGVLVNEVLRPDGARRVCGCSPDGRRMVWETTDRALAIYDVATRAMIASLVESSDYGGKCAYAPDGKSIVANSIDCKVKVWDSETGAKLLEMRGHSHFVLMCAFSPDGKRIVSTGHDKNLWIWDAASDRALLHFVGNGALALVNQHPFDPFLIVGGTGQNGTYVLRLHGIEICPPVTTAWRPPQGGTLAFDCPRCCKWSPVEPAAVGTDLACPNCNGPVRLNLFTIDGDWRPVAEARNAWRRHRDREQSPEI